MNHFPKYSVQNASQHNGFRVKWLGQIPGPRQRSKQSLLRVQFQFSRHQRAAINRQTLCVQCQAMMTQHVQNDPVRIEMFYMSFISRSALKKIHPKRQNVGYQTDHACLLHLHSSDGKCCEKNPCIRMARLDFAAFHNVQTIHSRSLCQHVVCSNIVFGPKMAANADGTLGSC